MATLNNSDILKGTIIHKKEDIPKASGFFLKPGVVVNEGDDVLLTGNYTSDESTVDTTIFKGVIEDINLHDIQKVTIVSKADEIDNIKPVGNYSGYTECNLGGIINAECSIVTCEETSSTINEEDPDEDVETVGWSIQGGEATFWESITDSNDATYIKTLPNSQNISLGFSNGLSGDHNYKITQVQCTFRAKYITLPVSCSVELWDGTQWLEIRTQSPIANVWTTYVMDAWTDLQLTQDDYEDFKIRITSGSPTGFGQVSEMYIKIWYTYYPNLGKSSYKSTQTYTGNKTLRQIFNWAKLQELKTWYLDPELEFYFNNGNVDSGVDISSSDKLSKVKGKKQIKNFDKVILLGGIVGGTQLTATSGAGDHIYTDTFANVDDFDILQDLADQILSDVQNYPLTVQMFRTDETTGFIQPGEEVGIEAGIKYSRSSNTITPGQYKIDRTKYYIINGVYKKIDLTLSDGMVFIKKESPSEQDEETNTLVNQVVAEGAEGGDLNDLDDVVISGTPADNEGLFYDTGTSKWINQTAAEAGLSASGHNHNLNDLAEKLHASLASVTTSQHHTKYTDAEAVQAVEDTGLVLSATKVITSADDDLNFIFGRAEIMGWTSGDYARYTHRDRTSEGNYMLLGGVAGDTYLNAATGATIFFRINNSNKMQMTAAGLTMSVPIVMGANAITSNDADLTFTFGRAQIDSRFADMVTISHRDMSTQDQYAFGQLNDGKTYINAPTGKLIYFHINDVEKMSLSVNSLHVSGVNITMAGAETVDGLDISAHKLAYDIHIGNGDSHHAETHVWGSHGFPPFQTYNTNDSDITNLRSIAFADGGSADIIRDEDNMASDDASALATQQSIKAYVDGAAGGGENLEETFQIGKIISGANSLANAFQVGEATDRIKIWHDGSAPYIDFGAGNVVFNCVGGFYNFRYNGANMYYLGTSKIAVYTNKTRNIGSMTYAFDNVYADDFVNRGIKFIEKGDLYERFKNMQLKAHPTAKNSVGDAEIDNNFLIEELIGKDRHIKQFKRKFVDKVAQKRKININDSETLCKTYKKEEDVPEDIRDFYFENPDDVIDQDFGNSIGQWSMVNTIILKELITRNEDLEKRIKKLEEK